MKKKILAFSSSKEGNSNYLQTAIPLIHSFLDLKELTIAFIPFAAVNPDYGMYTEKVRRALGPSPYSLQTAGVRNANTIIEKADAIMVGGGNTFKLLHDLYALHLMDLIKEKIKAGFPYIGWSAGSNIAGATICTSNDMPIINPGSFKALEFFPFQINPHYYNQSIEGFNGETRDQRLAEYLQLNPTIPVVALPEGTALLLDNGRLTVTGSTNVLVMHWENNGLVKKTVKPDDDLPF